METRQRHVLSRQTDIGRCAGLADDGG